MHRLATQRRAGPSHAMTDTNAHPRSPVIYTFKFDLSYHWAWMNQVRDIFTHPADQELFELCADFGAHLHPWALDVRMRETYDYTPEELVRPAEWLRAMELVRAHGADPRASKLEEFARQIEYYLASVADEVEAPPADIVDTHKQSGWTCSEFSLWSMFLLVVSAEELASITFHHDGVSPAASLTVSGPNGNTVLVIHFAADAIRTALARMHFENVSEGPDEVVAHLNAASDAHCQHLYAIARSNPSLDLWALEQLLTSA